MGSWISRCVDFHGPSLALARRWSSACITNFIYYCSYLQDIENGDENLNSTLSDERVVEEIVMGANRSLTELLTCLQNFEVKHTPLLMKTANLCDLVKNQLELIEAETYSQPKNLPRERTTPGRRWESNDDYRLPKQTIETLGISAEEHQQMLAEKSLHHAFVVDNANERELQSSVVRLQAHVRRKLASSKLNDIKESKE